MNQTRPENDQQSSFQTSIPAQTKTITVSSILLRDTKTMAAGFSLDTPSLTKIVTRDHLSCPVVAKLEAIGMAMMDGGTEETTFKFG